MFRAQFRFSTIKINGLLLTVLLEPFWRSQAWFSLGREIRLPTWTYRVVVRKMPPLGGRLPSDAENSVAA